MGTRGTWVAGSDFGVFVNAGHVQLGSFEVIICVLRICGGVMDC